MIIFLLVLVVIIGLFLGFLWGFKKESQNMRYGFGFPFGILLPIFVLTSIIIPLSNAGKVLSLEVFYEANTSNYAIAFSETKTILSKQRYMEEAFIPVEGSIEKTDLARITSQRLVEWRDEVNSYNIDLRLSRYFNSNPWTSYYMPIRPSSELKYLTIE